MNAKIQKMNRWRKQLAAQDVSYPKRASYDQLRRLAEKHLGGGGSSTSYSAPSSETDRQVDDYLNSLAGW